VNNFKGNVAATQNLPTPGYTLNDWTRAVGTDRYVILATIDAERSALRAENAELKRQVAELIGRMAAMEAK